MAEHEGNALAARDVDERDAQLRHLQAALDGISDAAVIVGPDLRLIAWNTRYVQQVGLRANRFHGAVKEGRRCHELLALDTCEKECLVKRALAGRRSLRIDEIQGRPGPAGDGAEVLTFIVSAVPLFDSSGEPLGALETYRDVTAEARIQTRYKALLDRERERAEQLEEMVRARTADLERSLQELKDTRAQLIQAEKLSSLGQLVAGLAHEINNPINFISSNVGFLREYVAALTSTADLVSALPLDASLRTALDEHKKQIDYDYARNDINSVVESMRVGAQRVTSIVEDLKRFVRGGAAELAMVDLSRAVELALSLLKHELKHRAEVVVDIEPDLPQVLANEGQLSQVFINLVVNAVHALGTNGKIVIKGMRLDGGVAVHIIDNGSGIPEKIQIKVFDPFFTTKPPGQGTGMGLAIAFSIVSSHGGKLTMKSKEGEGSAFTVWLPLPSDAERKAQLK